LADTTDTANVIIRPRLIGLAIAFNSLWLLLTLVPFALVIRYGVVAREEAYLERKFGDVYRGYRARVRRWL
jgi:protein-S-isoprenylcysteine O-methyltransferase Ste14